MDEIVQLLQDKAGLSQDQAQEVAKGIVQIIESKVPAQFQGIVGQILGGQGGDAQQGGLGSMLGSLGGMFGNK
jgi:hypothetical protein